MNAPQALAVPARTDRPLLGILFMLAAASFFPVMNGLAKLMSRDYSSEQVVWARTVSHLVFALALVVPRHGWGIVRTRRPGVQFLRSLLLIGSTFLFFSAIRFVPIAQAASISFIAPLIVVLLAGPMLGERIRLSRVVAVTIGFLGVLVVIRPGAAVFQWASLLIVGSAACFAVYQILTRRVAGVDRPETSVVYSALVGSVLMSLIVPFAWRTPGSLADVALLGSLGVLGGLGHYCVARAMMYAAANLLSPFQYWQMVGSVIVGWWLFSEMPDAWTWVGAALIIGAGVYVGLTSRDGPDDPGGGAGTRVVRRRRSVRPQASTMSKRADASRPGPSVCGRSVSRSRGPCRPGTRRRKPLSSVRPSR